MSCVQSSLLVPGVIGGAVGKMTNQPMRQLNPLRLLSPTVNPNSLGHSIEAVPCLGWCKIANGFPEQNSNEDEEQKATAPEQEGAEKHPADQAADVKSVEPTLPALNHSGQGEPEQVTAFNRGPLRLQGRTDADFDGGSFETTGVRVRPGTGCGGCGDCIHVTGTLVAHYSVATHVTLPSVSDYPNLTSCQRRRVQHAINTVLAPHEQRHVRAFRRYNGTTRRHFDLTLCRTEFDGAIDSMFQAEAQARQQAAQAASDALDPFFFDVDLDCDEPPAR